MECAECGNRAFEHVWPEDHRIKWDEAKISIERTSQEEAQRICFYWYKERFC